MARGYEVPTKPKWEPVVMPSPKFSGPVEARAYQSAVEASPRLPNEDIIAYLERINAKVREGYTYVREVGEEG